MASNLPQDPPHDLSRPGLGQPWGPMDDVRCGNGPDGLPYGPDELLPQAGIIRGMLVCVTERDKGIDRLALSTGRR